MRFILIFLSLLGPFKTFADSAGCDLVYRYDSLRSQTISAELQRAGLDVLEANLSRGRRRKTIELSFQESYGPEAYVLIDDLGSEVQFPMMSQSVRGRMTSSGVVKSLVRKLVETLRAKTFTCSSDRGDARHEPGEDTGLISIAERLRPRAIAIVTSIIRSPKGQPEDRLLLAKLQNARLLVGGTACDEKPTSPAYSPIGGHDIYFCPPLHGDLREYGDDGIVRILLHEAAHLVGVREEAQAHGIASTYMDFEAGRFH